MGRSVPAVDVCLSYLDALGRGDVDGAAARVSDGFVNEHTAALGEGAVGRDDYRRRLPGFFAALPGLRYEVEEVMAEGERVWVAYTLRAEVTGRPIALRGMMRFEVHDGVITRRVDYWDSLQFQRQAGLV